MANNCFIGTQPVRVLQELIPGQFENTFGGFKSLADQVNEQFGLHYGFAYHISELAILEKIDGHIQTPYVDNNNQIHIHETFLSYVWCISYAIPNFYNYAAGRGSEEIHEREITESAVFNNLFDYGVSLIKLFTPWDKDNLPNPEAYNPSISTNVRVANTCFLMAINFILCHEFAHIELDHKKIRQLNNNTATILETEKQADIRALSLMQFGMSDQDREIKSIGIIVGLFCLIYFGNKTTSVNRTHPDTDQRIHEALECLNPDIDSAVWGIAHVAYRFWDLKFGKWYSWNLSDQTNKESYYSFYQQIQAEKNVNVCVKTSAE